MNDKEHERVWEQARASGLSASEFIRRRVLKKQIVPKSDLVALGELTRILNELRRLGGLLKHIHTETLGRYSEDTRNAIRALEKYAHGLNAKLKEAGLAKNTEKEKANNG